MSNALHERSGSDRPAAEYRWLSALLLVLVGLRALAQWGVEPVVWWAQGVMGPDVVATAIYGAAVLAALGVVGVLAERVSDRSTRPGRAELVQVALATTGLVAAGTYAVVTTVPTDVPTPSVLVAGTYFTGMALLAAAFARSRDLPIRTAPPTAADGRAIAAGVLAVVGAVVVLRFGAAALNESLLDVHLTFGFGGATGPWSVVERTIAPAVFAAVGTALLFNGVVQESLRERAPAAAACAVTVLSALFDWVFSWLWSAFDGVVAVAAALGGTAVAAALALGAWVVWSRVDAPGGTLSRTVAAAASGAGLASVVALGGLAAFVAVSAFAVVGVVGYALALGVAAVTYERARTLWAPGIVLFSYAVVTDLVSYGLAVSMLG